MIKFLHKNNNENLVLFVHGFMGQKNTWSEKGVDKIPDYLIKNPEIHKNFDLAEFQYYTQLSSKLQKVKYFWGLAPLPWGSKKKFTQNLSIDDITDIFYSHLNVNLKKYNKIVIVAHSMGGLISKATILKLITKDKNKVELFLSLCVPHNGSKIADLAKVILSNPNVVDLAPLSALIDQVNRGWIDGKTAELLPETIYFQGKNDFVVPNESSAGYDSRDVQIVSSVDDHSSILTPSDSESIVIVAISDAILDTLKKKVKTKKRLFNAEISNESLDLLTEKIGKKLGANVISVKDWGSIAVDEPILATHISSRKIFIQKIIEENTKPWLAIYGMHETGKSQLSLLITKHLDIAATWLNFKNYEKESIIKKICESFGAENFEALKIKIDQIAQEGKRIIVLDDLPKLGTSQSADNFLNSFLSYCFSKKIDIISTSNHRMSNSLVSVHADKIAEIEIIPMTEEETFEVLETYPKSLEFDLKEVIHTITGGHPSYLQFVCRFLDDRNWIIEKEELLKFLSGSLFNDLNEETLSKFVSNIENSQSRDLMYRLNIIKSDISDKEIKIVSECNPEIERPLEKINSVIGTWIQKRIEFYSLSPLFKRLGVENITQKLFRQISYNLGKSLMEKKNLSQYEVRNLINYFRDAEKYDNAGFIVLTLLQKSSDNSDFYYNSRLHYTTWYFESLPEKMALILRLYIRTLQFNIAVSRESEHDHAINFLRTDLAKLVDEALENKIDVYLPALILSSSYLREDSENALKYFSYYINSSNYKKLPETSIVELNQISNYDSSLIWLILMTIDNIPSLINWFENTTLLPQILDETENEQPFLLSNSLFQNFIKKELATEIPNWIQLDRQFSEIYELASKYNLEILKALSIKYQIRIQSEMLHNIDAAEQLYFSYNSDLKSNLQIFLLNDELGRQLYLKDEKEKAKRYLELAASYLPEKFVTSKAESLQILALITSDNEQIKAHFYMEQLYEFVHKNIFIAEVVLIQFIGEYATSLYTIGNDREAMIKFIEGYEILLDTFEDSDDYYNLQLKFGNAIGYLQKLIETGTPPLGDTFTRPYRGMFTGVKDLKDLFFHEKLQIVSFVILTFYELENNMTEAGRWAGKIFELKEKVDIKIFGKMLTQLHGYHIIQGNYSAAVEQQIEVERLTNELLKAEVQQINNEEQHTITSKIKQATEKTVNGQDSDLECMLMVLNPILFHLLTRFLKGEIYPQELADLFKDVLSKCRSSFVNHSTLDYLESLITHLPQSNTESLAVITHINQLPQPSHGYLQYLGYLICTLNMEPKHAIEMHFKLSHCFLLYAGVANNSIIIPFYFEFWNKKIQEKPKLFKEVRRLESNLKFAYTLSIKYQLPAIFSLVSNSLGYNVPENDKVWLNDYLEQYGES
jgi:hypothetical protein